MTAPPTTPAARRSLRIHLLGELGFFTSAAVLLVGVTTAVVLDGDLRATALPLLALWSGSMLVFALFGAHLVKRVVIAPLECLVDEAETLATGDLSAPRHQYESVEFDRLADRYRATTAELLDVQAHVVRVEKLAGIGQLAAGVAHEVRNPLGALATYVEVLRRRGAAQDVVAEMEQAIRRVDRIVQGLLDYAKPGILAGECDLNAAVQVAVDFLAGQGVLRDHNLVVALAADLPLVRGVPHALEQVVVNLLLNAAQASTHGRIAVGTVVRTYDRQSDAPARATDHGIPAGVVRRAAERGRPQRPDLAPGTQGALLYVADDGPGVPVANRERIFDPFFTTKEPGEGTGLGLAIVARTVHEAGGVVWVDPARERGAVFKVFLPLAAATPCTC